MNFIRLYKFCGCLDHALDSIRERHLKVATGADINDPFEILPLSLPKNVQRRLLRNYRAQVFRSVGIISFSETWQNPLMWSHYGHNHKSLCLGFDVETEKVFKVNYVKKMPKANIEVEDKGTNLKIDLDNIGQLAATKSKHWEYEKEHRKFVSLEGRNPYSSGPLFYPMNSRMRLREVIVGAECDATIEDVEDVVGDLDGVKIFPARLAFHSFKVTKQQDQRLWNRRNKSQKP